MLRYIMATQEPKAVRRRGRPVTGRALTAAERMKRSRDRRKAAGFRLQIKWVLEDADRPIFSTHRIAEARSLAMHAVITRKIHRNRELLAIACANLVRWREQAKDSPPSWLEEWQLILERPWPAIAALLTEPSENAARLRQSSPFAGVLSDAERERIYETFRA